MLEKELCFKTRSELTSFEILDNDSLVFSTQIHGAKIFSYKKCTAEKNLSIELLGHQTTASSFSPDQNLFAFANATTIYILDTNTKLIIQTILTYDGEIEKLFFIPQSSYILAGTKHGRVIQYRFDGRAQISRLCSFGHTIELKRNRVTNNYVSAFAFYKGTLACTGYGGVITILNMNSYANKQSIQASKLRINILCFLNEHQIVSGGADGIIRIHSLQKCNATKKIATPFKNINNILVMQNTNFLIVSGDAKELVLINLNLEKIVSNAYISFEAYISKILLTKSGTLLVSLSNNEIYKINLPSTDDLKNHILDNNFDKAYQLIDKDPMLQNTHEHKRVEEIYQKFYTQAVKALIEFNTKEARKLIQIFGQVPSKTVEVTSIFKAFENYQHFKMLCIDKNITLAYALCERFPALKYTFQFKRLEDDFKNAFTFAQRQILIGRDDIARGTLYPYTTILNKKNIVKLLLNKNIDFRVFLKAIQKKDYETIDILAQKHEIFMNIPTYITLKKDIDKSLESITKLIYNIKIEKAIEEIKKLVLIPHIKSELQDLYKEAKLVLKLQNAYEKNNFTLCYEIIDKKDSLKNMKLVSLLEEHWMKLVNKCEYYAMEGNFQSIKEELGELINIKTRVSKIGDLFRLSFHIKIKSLLSKRKFKSTEHFIYKYIDIFGIDSELRTIMQTYVKHTKTKLAITLEQSTKNDRNSWLKHFTS